MSEHLTDSDLQDIAEGMTTNIMQTHLTNCAACRQRLIFFEALMINLDEKDEIAIPANFADEVMSSITALKEIRKEKAFSYDWLVFSLAGIISMGGIAFTISQFNLLNGAVFTSPQNNSGDFIKIMLSVFFTLFAMIVYYLFSGLKGKKNEYWQLTF
jgi:hypothetical protein